MPLDLFDNVIDRKRIYVACNTYVNRALQKEAAPINTEKLVSELDETVKNYYEGLGLQRTEDIKTISDNLIKEAEQIYNDGIQLPIIDIVKELRQVYLNLLIFIYPLVVFFIALIILCLLKLYQHRHRAVRYINYAMLAASLLLIGMSTGFLFYKSYEWFNVLPDYYGIFFSAFSRLNIQACLYVGVFSLLISAVLIAFTAYLKKQYYNK